MSFDISKIAKSIPGIATAACGISLVKAMYEENLAAAALSAIGMVPGAGTVANWGRFGATAAKGLNGVGSASKAAGLAITPQVGWLAKAGAGLTTARGGGEEEAPSTTPTPAQR